MTALFPDRHPQNRVEVKAWALPDLFDEAVAMAEGGPDKHEAVRLHQRLQRGLMGSPTQTIGDECAGCGAESVVRVDRLDLAAPDRCHGMASC